MRAMTQPPDDAALDELLAFADTLADAARAIVRRHFRKPLAVDHKDAGGPRGQPVTVADHEVERALRALIEERYPDHGIVGEELGEVRADSPWQWFLDPIDGTRAFIAGLPLFGTLIGLGHRGRPLLGVVDQAVLGERFVGSAKGAFLDRAPIRTRACPRLEEAVFAITDPDMMATQAERAAYRNLRRRAGVTQFGGNCYAYAMLAAGAIDLVVEADLKPWDVYALVPLVEAAGGVIADWSGGPAETATRVVACGDAALYDEVAPLLAGASAPADDAA
jgi:histidinol phosphatase-like enzyme (inositol monophosphatase family)